MTDAAAHTLEVDDARDAAWLELAMTLASETATMGNIPVGAVVVVDNSLVAEGANLREITQDPTAHAELIVLRKAAQKLGRWRMPEATLYVTLEPCIMCAGAIAQARIGRVVYGALEPKTGAIQSQHALLDGSATEATWRRDHADSCAGLMQRFFQARRADSATK